MKTILASVTVLALLLTAATAHAAIFQGRASDGTQIKLRTNAKGKPDRITFGDYRADCDAGYTRIESPITGFVDPFTEVSQTHVLDQGRAGGQVELDDVSGPVHVVGTWKFEARLVGGSWVGNYRTRGNYEQNNERITRCATRFSFELSAR